MNRAAVFAIGLALAANNEITCAYEPLTHFDLSREAGQKSVLGQANTLADLGFSKAIDDATQKFPSTPGDQSNQFLPGCLHSAELSIMQLIACGSQFEDVPGTRSLNHFFDPVRGIPLTIGIGKPGSVVGLPNLKSPDWALQDTGSEDAGSAQEFAYRNARDYFNKAVISRQQSERDTNWGKLFQSIGQVIHHPQDMAQPQHVRNDAHCDSLPCALANVITLGTLAIYSSSRYEKHTSIGLTLSGDPVQQVIQQLASTADGNVVYPGANNANVSIFNTPRKFFVGAGKGLAEYTNQNFLSQGTNFTFNNGVVGTHPSYSLPIPGQANSIPANAPQLFPNGIPNPIQAACNFDPANCFLTFYSTSGTDPLTGLPFTNDRASAQSIFDQDLQTKIPQTDPLTGRQYLTERIFALNRFNFDAANQFLIPRAVAYSAGMINYFFRGKLDVETLGTSTLSIKNLSAEALLGDFGLYYDDAQGNRNPVTITRCRVGGVDVPADQGKCKGTALASASVDAAASLAVDFSLPTSPAPKSDGEYMLVFAGTLGEEKPENGSVGAVVAKAIRPVLAGLLVTPNYRPTDGIAGTRLIQFQGATWTLNSANTFQAGNVDWKGRYKNGKPTKVISWKGYQGRYIAKDFSERPFTPNIYQAGELFAVAPGPVLGAALTLDAKGKEWLVAITGLGTEDTVYLKPATKSVSTVLFDAVTAPEGWRIAGTYAHSSSNPVPWFFNGDGNEAQRIVTLSKGSGRAKMTLNIADRLVPAIQTSEILFSPTVPPDIFTNDTVAFGDIKPRIVECPDPGPAISGSGTKETTTRIRHNAPLLLAVDYADSQEVTADVSANSTSVRVLTKVQQITIDFEYQGDPSSCSIKHYTSVSTFSSDLSDRNQGGKRYRLGALTIEAGLTGEVDQHDGGRNLSDVDCSPASCDFNVTRQAPDLSGSSGTASVRVAQDRYRLVYFDLRSDTAILYRHRVAQQASGPSSAGVPSLFNVPSVHSEEIEVFRDGGSTVHSIASFTGTPPGCSGSSICSFSSELSSIPIQLGYGRDLSGRDVYSIAVDQQFIAPIGSRKFFDGLSGGALRAVIPGAPPAASYFPVGVVR